MPTGSSHCAVGPIGKQLASMTFVSVENSEGTITCVTRTAYHLFGDMQLGPFSNWRTRHLSKSVIGYYQIFKKQSSAK